MKNRVRTPFVFQIASMGAFLSDAPFATLRAEATRTTE
jgi:hypothetical protein